jgi:predicted dehydrogenase
VIRLGAIGLGTRATHIASLLCQEDREVRMTLVADPSTDAARQRMLDAKIDAGNTQFITSDDAMFDRADDIDALIIGTRCNLHAKLASRWAAAKKPLFLEKPVGLNVPELQALADAWAERESLVVVSFPLRVTPLIQRVVQIAKSGRLGTINQVQAFNYVPYGGVYFGQWYRDFETTGGLWLQKATHDFDYINHLIQSVPTHIAAMGSRRIYGGDMPPEQRCGTCPRADVCPEGPIAIRDRGDDGGMGYGDHACAFSTSIRHHDAATALIRYENGVHASYAHNFVTRRSAAWRGARITGYRATLEFDWYDETIRVIDHHATSIEEIKVTVPQGHHGGDSSLIRNFLDVIHRRDASHATLQEGLVSAAMCVAAQTSEEAQEFVAIEHVRASRLSSSSTIST